MWFDFSRSEGFPTQYAPNETPVTFDVLEAGFFCAFIILLVSSLILIPSINFTISFSRFVRIVFILTSGLLLLLGNFGQEWEVGRIVSKTPYKSGTAAEINAAIGIKIGLRSVNVTLKSIGEIPPALKQEIINYNERFTWAWDQGRFGFGPYAGHLQREFREAQYRGLPLPILWIMDYFVIDGEGFRYGRFYRTAGWYSHIALWCAFTCWILAIILLKTVITYGALWLGLCGILQLVSNLLWAVIRNPMELNITFANGAIQTKFGSSFWLTFISGIINLTAAITIIIIDFVHKEALYTFFQPDKTVEDEVYLSNTEVTEFRNKNRQRIPDVPLIEMGNQRFISANTDPEMINRPIYKRKTIMRAPSIRRDKKPKHLVN